MRPDEYREFLFPLRLSQAGYNAGADTDSDADTGSDRSGHQHLYADADKNDVTGRDGIAEGFGYTDRVTD